MKRVCIYVSPEFLASLCRPTEEISISISSELPEDAKYISSFYDARKDLFCLLFEHESFLEVEYGVKCPVLGAPVIKKVEKC